MKITILNQAVRQNVLLFKQLIMKTKQKIIEKQQKTATKAYAAFINRKTGEIRFAELEKNNDHFASKDWKSIRIQVRASEPEDTNVFEVTEERPEPGIFDYKDLEPRAYRIMTETIKLLNNLSTSSSASKNPVSALEEISILEIEPLKEDRKKDIIHAAWHRVDRLGAEKLLRDQSVGTYLFRKDEYAYGLEEKLNEHFKEKILCITLTYRSVDKKICDKTILLRGDQWMFYDDDPNLRAIYYPNIESLLNSMGETLRQSLPSL